MIVESFYSHLKNDSGVSAITSEIYPKVLPENVTLPAIVYGVDSDGVEQLVDGGTSDLKEALIYVDCYASTYLSAWQLAKAVEALAGTTGTLGTHSPANIVDTVRLERPSFDLFESDTERYRVSVQLYIAYY